MNAMKFIVHPLQRDRRVQRALRQRFVAGGFFKVVRRNNSPLQTSLIRTGPCIRHPKLPFNTALKEQHTLNDNVYISRSEFQKFTRRIVSRAQHDPNFSLRYERQALEDCRRYIRTMKVMARSRDDRRVMSEFARRSQFLASHLFPPLALEEWLQEEVVQGVAARLGSGYPAEEMKNILETLLLPSEPSSMQQRRLAILKLSLSIQRKAAWRQVIGSSAKRPPPALRRAIVRFHDRYAWLPDHYCRRQYESIEKIRKELATLTRQPVRRWIIEMRQTQRAHQASYHTLSRSLRIPSSLQALIEATRLIAVLRLIRLEVLSHAVFLLQATFARIESSYKLPSITDMYYWEILDVLDGKSVDSLDIRRRRHGFGLSVIGRDIYPMSSQQAAKLERLIAGKIEGKKQVAGQIACNGWVRGIARVLSTGAEAKRVRRGDILITSMTTPDFVPAMERAAAFVTDEGGISCHAAIVSREMNKPCVIGTKIATQVFKDGDRVEVDANKGIVRKLDLP